MDVISFDIETIPQQTVLSKAQEEEYAKREEAYIKRNYSNGTDITEEEKKSFKKLTMGTSPYLGEIVCIGLHKVNSAGEKGSIGIVGTEEEILNRFWKNLKNFKGLFVSFNGLNFDVPFILKRSMYHKILPTNNNFLDVKRYSRWPHFDVKLVMGDFDRFAPGTLDLICNFLGVESPKNGEIKAENVEEAYLNGQIDKIAEYCVRDVEATYKAYEQLRNYTYNTTKYK